MFEKLDHSQSPAIVNNEKTDLIKTHFRDGCFGGNPWILPGKPENRRKRYNRSEGPFPELHEHSHGSFGRAHD
jgi:hypothetical protein